MRFEVLNTFLLVALMLLFVMQPTEGKDTQVASAKKTRKPGKGNEVQQAQWAQAAAEQKRMEENLFNYPNNQRDKPE